MTTARTQTAAPADTGTAGETPAAPLEGSTAMSSISNGHEDISILGTGIDKIPGIATPEFDGLRIDDDGTAIARIVDGALCIEVDDIDVALAWRNAWQHAVSHLVIHREKAEGRS